ncbi:MAG: CHASE domain-containing protein, partial [Sedimentisphaerales bacterium]|nr:CHASE domain-containing protein [Sedimentisphaerales bacterium]
MDITTCSTQLKGSRRKLAVLVFISAAIFMLTVWEIVRTNHTMRAELLDNARLIAKSLNLNDIKSLSGTKQDLKKPEYYRLKEYFGALKASDSKYRFIYLMGKQTDGTVVFYVCNEPEGSLEEVLAGDVYQDIPKGFEQTFATGTAQIEGPYTDRWGKFVGAAIPVLYNSEQHAQVVLAVDINASHWNKKLIKAAIPPLILALALLLIYIIWLILTLKNKSLFNNNKWQYYIEPCLIAAIGVTVTLYAAWSLAESEKHARLHAFNHVASTRTEAVVDAFDDLQKIELESLAKFIESSDDITQDDFLHFTSFLTSNKAIQGWEWIPAVKSENKIEFQEKVRATGIKDFTIWHKDEKGFRQPAIGREVYYPIHLVTTGETNEMAQGFDLGSEPVRHKAIEEAIRTRLSTCTEPVSLLQNQQDKMGLLVLRPIYSRQKQNELRGFAMAVLRMSSFLRQIASDNSALIELSILARETPARVVAVSWDKDYTNQTELYITCPINVLGRCFIVKVYGDQTFDILYPKRAFRHAAIMGLILTIALVSIAGIIQHRRLELETLISERTNKLQASELMQKSLMESLPIGVAIIDPETRIIESINPHVSVLFGAPAEDVIGKKCNKLLCPADKDKCPICDLNQNIDNSDREMMRADGSKIPVLKTVKKITLDGQEKLLECFVDVSTQKKTETDLANALDNLTMATKAGRVGIWSYDIASNTFTADNQLGRLYGFKDGQFNGQYNSWMSYIHPDDRQEYYNQFQMTLNDIKELNFEFRIIWTNGVVRHIHSLAQLQKDANGKPIAIIGTSLDITRTKNIELNLKETISKLEEANVRANQLAEIAEIANKTKSEFLANMSHEIRTPMNSILGFSDMLMEGELTEDQRDIVQTINRSGNSLLTLINDILDLSKIEAGKMNI